MSEKRSYEISDFDVILWAAFPIFAETTKWQLG